MTDSTDQSACKRAREEDTGEDSAKRAKAEATESHTCGTEKKRWNFKGKTQNQGPKCYRCNQYGHMADDCTNQAKAWRDRYAQLWKGKRHILAVGYVGTRYCGMQWQAGQYEETPTIEGTVMQTLHEAGLIPCRPDKGQVHVLCNHKCTCFVFSNSMGCRWTAATSTANCLILAEGSASNAVACLPTHVG